MIPSSGKRTRSGLVRRTDRGATQRVVPVLGAYVDSTANAGIPAAHQHRRGGGVDSGARSASPDVSRLSLEERGTGDDGGECSDLQHSQRARRQRFAEEHEAQARWGRRSSPRWRCPRRSARRPAGTLPGAHSCRLRNRRSARDHGGQIPPDETSFAEMFVGEEEPGSEPERCGARQTRAYDNQRDGCPGRCCEPDQDADSVWCVRGRRRAHKRHREQHQPEQRNNLTADRSRRASMLG